MGQKEKEHQEIQNIHLLVIPEGDRWKFTNYFFFKKKEVEILIGEFYTNPEEIIRRLNVSDSHIQDYGSVHIHGEVVLFSPCKRDTGGYCGICHSTDSSKLQHHGSRVLRDMMKIITGIKYEEGLNLRQIEKRIRLVVDRREPVENALIIGTTWK